MSNFAFADALRPIASRMPTVVREHEVLRVTATIRDASPRVAEATRQEVLRWAGRRSGGRLPDDAWASKNFEFFSGGRNSLGVRIAADETDIWAIRADDPDKSVPGRTWTNEVVVGAAVGQPLRFSVRQLVSTSEDILDIVPHSPGFIQQVSGKFGLWAGTARIDKEPWLVDSEYEADRLVEHLLDAQRGLPVFVLTVPEQSIDTVSPLLDAGALARATVGTAQIVILCAAYTWTLTSRLGRVRSVFGGAVRAYLPGFNDEANPYAHRLVLAESLFNPDGGAQCVRWLQSLAAAESLRRTTLGKDVLAFGAIRNASFELRQRQLEREGASDSVQLDAAKGRIKALEAQLYDQQTSLDYFDGEHKNAEERAETAEEQARASAFRIQQLLEQLRLRGDEPDRYLALPPSWSEFANWCDVNLAGRVTLTPSARRSVRSPEFEDMQTAARCLLWLANECRDSRINGGDGGLDRVLEEGIRNSHCGSDAFDLTWQGQRYTADWHIKNGGNTREPRRCLRIYYFWDTSSQQIVIAEMPAHRRTGAS